MPLLSLPTELLLEIIGLTIEAPGEVPSCTPPNVTALAHTCQLLRALSLPIMYTSCTIDRKSTPRLQAILASSVPIAGFIRQLSVMDINHHEGELLPDILMRCTNLQDLHLGSSFANPSFTPQLLVHLFLQSQLAPHQLRHFYWEDIMLSLKFAPRGLQRVVIENSVTIARLTSVPKSDPATPLTKVHTLICNSSLFENRGPSDGGAWLAPVMPNLQRLDLSINRRSMVLLEAYAELGTRLKELKLFMGSQYVDICTTVAKFAPELRRYNVNGGSLCETLFKVDWACVEVLKASRQRGCRGVRLEELREGLLKVVAARPGASITVKMEADASAGREKGVELARYGRGVGGVASLEEFQVFKKD